MASTIDTGEDFNPDHFINREQSWLEFNRRVLYLSMRPDFPLLEKTRFLAIWSSNLDEFFQVRVAGLKEQVAHGVGSTPPDGMTPTQQLAAIRADVELQYEEISKHFLSEVAPALASEGIGLVLYSSLEDDDREFLDTQFREIVFPVVTPLAVDPSHPFPYISNLSLNLAIFVRNPETSLTKFARVKVPPILPRFVVLPDGERFVPLEQVIAAHVDEFFPRHGSTESSRVQGHAQRRHRNRRGRGWRPAYDNRVGVDPTALWSCGPT